MFFFGSDAENEIKNLFLQLKVSGVQLLKNLVMVIKNSHNAPSVDELTYSFFTLLDEFLSPSLVLGTRWNHAAE